MRLGLLFLLIWFGLGSAVPGWGATWQVLSDGSGDAQTIQAGIDSAAIGDTVLVGPGTYPETIDFLGKNIVVRSSHGAQATVLDGSGLGRYVVRFLSGEGREAVLDGLTVRGDGIGIAIFQSQPSILRNIVRDNHGTSIQTGAGIMMSGDGQPGPWVPLIQGNTVIYNESEGTSGGIGCQQKVAPEIINNYIAHNRAGFGDGAGIWIRTKFDGTVIRGNTLEDNIAGDHGGGIYLVAPPGYTPEAEISYNVLFRNVAEGRALTGNSGGGIWLERTDAWVHHNTIVENTGGGSYHADGGGIAVSNEIGSPLIEQNIIAYSPDGSGIRCDEPATPTIRNNLSWQNVGGDGKGSCKGWALTDGNIIADPLFCGRSVGDLSVAADSPALMHPAGPLGALIVAGCQGTPVRVVSWGTLKARYRTP